MLCFQDLNTETTETTELSANSLAAPLIEREAKLLVEHDLTGEIVDSAIEVHRVLGPGLLESVYRTCLIHQLNAKGLKVDSEVPVAIRFKDLEIPTGYRADVIVEDRVLLELKAVERTLPLHEAQILTYLKLTGIRVG